MSGSRATFTQSVSQLAQEEAAATSSLFLAGIPLPSSPEQAFRIKQQQKKEKKEKNFVFDVHSTRCEKERETKHKRNGSVQGAVGEFTLHGTLHAT